DRARGEVSGRVLIKRGAFEVVSELPLVAKQRLDLGAEAVIGTAAAIEIGQAIRLRGDLQRVQEDALGQLVVGMPARPDSHRSPPRELAPPVVPTDSPTAAGPSSQQFVSRKDAKKTAKTQRRGVVERGASPGSNHSHYLGSVFLASLRLLFASLRETYS